MTAPSESEQKKAVDAYLFADSLQNSHNCKYDSDRTACTGSYLRDKVSVSRVVG